MKIFFTTHVKNLMQTRKILEDEVTDIIRFSQKIVKRRGKYVFITKLQRGTVEVVCEQTERYIDVITVYWR